MTRPYDAGRRRFSSRDAVMIVGGVVLAWIAWFVWSTWMAGADPAVEAEQTQSSSTGSSSNQVTVTPEVLDTAGLELVPVSVGPAAERLATTGVVEANQQAIHQVTPLVGGRIERVHVALGDQVRMGAVLLSLASPQIAEMQGGLRAAEAKLTETEATLTRTRRLVELGAGAGKDLNTAEAEYQTAQAQVTQLRQSLQALGAPTGAAENQTLISSVAIRAPMAGSVIERAVNPGAWIEAGASVLTIADLRTVWVIANVPESRLNIVRLRAPVEIRAPTLTSLLSGRVNYIDPQLDQATRNARVRIEVPNTAQSLKVGMFVDVTIQGPSTAGNAALTVPSEAIQRIGERTIVFMATSDPRRFDVRDVEVGDEVQGMRVIQQGLAAGDRVVTKGGFTLKSQLLKGQFGEDEAIAGEKR